MGLARGHRSMDLASLLGKSNNTSITHKLHRYSCSLISSNQTGIENDNVNATHIYVLHVSHESHISMHYARQPAILELQGILRHVHDPKMTLNTTT